MSVLANPRHELFAQALASGKTATEAIALAGYRPNGRNADVLKKRQEIARRVAELQTRHLVKEDQNTAISVQRLREQLAEAYELAKQQNRPGDMALITEKQAKLDGKWTERSEVTTRQADADKLSNDELAAIALGEGKLN